MTNDPAAIEGFFEMKTSVRSVAFGGSHPTLICPSHTPSADTLLGVGIPVNVTLAHAVHALGRSPGVSVRARTHTCVPGTTAGSCTAPVGVVPAT